MPEAGGTERSVFDPIVASHVQDLLDARMAPPARKPSQKPVMGPAGAVVGWTAGAQDCLRLLTDLIDDVDLAPQGKAAERDDAFRRTLDLVREALGGVLDGQTAAIWFSLPFDDRVLRLRRLARRVDEMRHRAETAATHRAKIAALRRLHGYVGILEDRARLDPIAAGEAGCRLGVQERSIPDL